MSIKKIMVKDTELTANRVKQIKGFIKTISANESIHPQRVPAGENKIVFCVTDESKITNLSQFDKNSEITERFKTKNRNFTASYYEIWDRENGSKQDFCLNRIYFHLYLSEDDKDYILLHTDPTDNDLIHGIYKRSPHLHIKNSKDNIIAHAHIALNINDYDVALSSLAEINKCIKNHIDMLSHQILEIR